MHQEEENVVQIHSMEEEIEEEATWKSYGRGKYTGAVTDLQINGHKCKRLTLPLPGCDTSFTLS